jgi:Putative Ig domain
MRQIATSRARVAVLLLACSVVLGMSAVAAPAQAAKPGPGTCQIVPETLTDGNVGVLNTWFVLTTGCSTSQKPVRFKLVDGRLPDGTRLFTQGVSSGGITGVPETAGLFEFTLQVRDATGSSDTESFSILIQDALPLTVTTEALSSAVVGEFYCCGNLFASGGVPGYSWSLASGQLPPGLELSESPGAITGTPTEAGVFAFVVRVTDSDGTSAERALSITVG